MKRVLSLLIIFLFFDPIDSFGQGGVSDEDYDMVVAQVDALFGSLYSVELVINVDSSVGNPTASFGAIENPYGTLTDCYIFVAQGREQSPSYTPRGFVGIFKNGQILWRSDTVVNNDLVGAPKIFATSDLNKDGTVDIVVSWKKGARADYFWIFDWNGQTGLLLSAINEKNESIVVSERGRFEFVDVDGDGIIEIQGYWPEEFGLDPTIAIYSWNGQLYGKWTTTPSPPSSGFLPRANVEASVQASVVDIDSLMRYTYTIQNDEASVQKLDEFLLQRHGASILNSVGRPYWRFAIMKRSLMGWTNLFVKPNLISQGETETGFVLESSGLPTIVVYYLRGHNPPINQGEFDETLWYTDVIQNSDSGHTLGPEDVSGLDSLQLIGRLIQLTVQAYELQWITNGDLYGNFTSALSDVEHYIADGSIKNALDALNNAVMVIDNVAYPEPSLTEEGSALLKYNLGYLVKRLQQ